ncbi:PREDICTED: transcription factor SPT20 homolog [Elephantulus edwardii]|uniref:transcription factor SPT20 homolog n=1 Tax=Elephantulus edwardii TaxID=28737 RepID=UPI0003F0B6AA|nr:PREDICTED: transcription factor SPT20 homolog [Elephantulus edwardii]
MQHDLEKALDRADYLIESVQERPPKRKHSSSERKSIFQKLYDIYAEECEKETEGLEGLRTNVNLLEKLVAREKLACLVVTLYPGNEGYSLMLRGENGSESKTIQLPYEQKEFLDYLDAQELPPILIDLLEKSKMAIFYSGCVIAEIRDYRQCSNMHYSNCQSRHILLRPTMQTLVHDVHSLTNDGHEWTQEDKLELESQLLLATAEPLCLEPSVAVACTENRLLYNQQKMNTHSMKQCFRRYSITSQTQQTKLLDSPPPSQFRSFPSCSKIKNRKVSQPFDLKISKVGSCVDAWKQHSPDLAVPSQVDLDKYAKEPKFPKPTDSKSPDRAHCGADASDSIDSDAGTQGQKVKLHVMQSLDDPLVSGMIPPYEAEENVNTISPFQFSVDHYLHWFMNGPQTAAEKVVNQYQDEGQKEAKRPAKMSLSLNDTANVSQPSKKDLESPPRVSSQSSAVRKEVTLPPSPIRLFSSPGTTSSVKSSPAQQARATLQSPRPSASEPPVPSQKSSVDLIGVPVLSPTVMSAARSLQKSKTTPAMESCIRLKFSKVVGSRLGAWVFKSGEQHVLSNSPAAGTTAKTSPVSSSGPSGVILLLPAPRAAPSAAPAPGAAPTPRAVPVAAPAAAPVPVPQAMPGAAPVQGAAPVVSQAGVPIIFKKASSTDPASVLRLPAGQLFLVSEQQSSRVTPQSSQCPTTLPQQTGGQDSAQGSRVVAQALPVKPAIVIKLSEAQHDGVSSQSAEQSLPQQTIHNTTSMPQQQIRVKILPRSVSVCDAATQTTPPQHQLPIIISCSKDKMKTDTASTPN